MRKQGLAQMSAKVGQEKPKFEAHREKFLQKQRAALEADNMKARAQLAQLGEDGPAQNSRQEIEEEARRLYARSKTASATEAAEIEKRAAELLLLLKSLPVRAGVRSKPAVRQ